MEVARHRHELRFSAVNGPFGLRFRRPLSNGRLQGGTFGRIPSPTDVSIV